MEFKKLNQEFKLYFENEMKEYYSNTISKNNCELLEFYKAVEYSLFSGGKRIRPMIMINTYNLLGGKNKEVIFRFALALEMIHTYSLVHDDLPAMDNDDFRRGKLTSHKKYGEDIAILVGDALLNHAFELMSSCYELENVDFKNILRAINDISTNAGMFGMVGGQALEIISSSKSSDNVKLIETLKTAKLFITSLSIAGILAGVSDEKLLHLQSYGTYIGRAFQIKDDIMDMGTENVGMFSLDYSEDKVKNEAEILVEKAIIEINKLNIKTDFFESLAKYMVNRDS